MISEVREYCSLPHLYPIKHTSSLTPALEKHFWAGEEETDFIKCANLFLIASEILL